jgi:hypothetical protein
MEKTNLLHEVEREEMLNQSYHVKHTEEQWNMEEKFWFGV